MSRQDYSCNHSSCFIGYSGQKKTGSLEGAFVSTAYKFKIPSLNKHEKLAIEAIVLLKKDVFVNLPTGFRKSLIYHAFPLLCDRDNISNITKLLGHIVVIFVSPLVSLMEDQVNHLTIGVSAVNISCQAEIMWLSKQFYRDITDRSHLCR